MQKKKNLKKSLILYVGLQLCKHHFLHILIMFPIGNFVTLGVQPCWSFQPTSALRQAWQRVTIKEKLVSPVRKKITTGHFSVKGQTVQKAITVRRCDNRAIYAYCDITTSKPWQPFHFVLMSFKML